MNSFSIFYYQNTKMRSSHIGTWLLTVILILSSWLPTLAATQIDIVGPSGSVSFGKNITLLANGNFVVADPDYDLPNGTLNVGAVYLYNGVTGTLMSILTGDSSGDQVSNGGVIALPNGNYVVVSPFWDSDFAPNVGAVTWVSGTSAVNGVVNSSNSLVGSTKDDNVGAQGVIALHNGNYLVVSVLWNNGTSVDAGAVTWGNGNTGIRGTVSINNSLVGKSTGAQVGSGGVTELRNGNYVVRSPSWPSSLVPNFGAVTWGNGNTGISGAVIDGNSLVGGKQGDYVGASNLILLSNGNYLVLSPEWDNGNAIDAGAVTWGNGDTGIKGIVSSDNSLVGSTQDDKVGADGVTVLSNSNYVVSSHLWDNGNIIDAGAATWGNGATGISGPVNSSNSLIGSTKDDRVSGAIALSNGNYVVCSVFWDDGNVIDAGAATWGNGDTGISGPVNSSNSLIGSTNYDMVGFGGVTALSNGNYVVSSYLWDNGIATDAGAVIWGNGSTGISGPVSSNNSLIGSTSNDRVGKGGVTTLSNGNYVVASADWDHGLTTDAGAVTWGNGSTGVSGAVSSSNSLVGSAKDDEIGEGGVTVLSQGHYVVRSRLWDNGLAADAGAVTWGNGSTGINGPVNSSNSLVGGTKEDLVGSGGVTALSNGNYVVASFLWDNGLVTDVGAATWGNGNTGVYGLISSNNSLIGSTDSDQVGMGGVTALSNGNYVVISSGWNNGIATDVGAVTWANGSTGIRGPVNTNNSLSGSTSTDAVGNDGVTALSDGNYVVVSSLWDNGQTTNAGAVTWGSGRAGAVGPLTSSNSAMGKLADGGMTMNFAYDATYGYLVVGRPTENSVTLLRLVPPEIAVTGKAVAIANGASSPNSSDGTDLGAIVVGAGALTQDFTIHNSGEMNLTVTAITLSGVHANDFSISGATMPLTLTATSSVTFTLTFTPSATGLRSATVNIANDDSDENPYTFAVQGTGTQHKLTTTKAGNGTGSLTLSPAGGNYNHNTVVTVTAKADAGSTFAGWSGACSGNGACSVTMTGAKSVTATFNKNGGSSQKVYLPVVMK